jgi:hypothetical protein
MSMLKFLLFTAALATVVPTLGCQRRVVILSFNAPTLGRIDSLFIEGIEPQKAERELSGLQQTIGYYDVSTDHIRVRVRACADMEVLGDHTASYPVMSDEVTIPIDGIIDPGLYPPRRCGMGLARKEGGSPDLGTGGELGGDGVGGAGDDSGGSALGGAGGDGTGLGGASGADGGAPDTAECGTDTHAPVCDPPSGDPGAGDIPDPPTISSDCMQYCSNMHNKCGGIYDSDDACQRYCALAGWAASGNSLACRNIFLTPAAPPSSYCMAAGPDTAGNCGGACPIFCAAWIGICHHDPSEMSACVDACMMKATATNGAEPACRFQLLQRALYDTRYCDYVKFGSCFSCD